MSEKRPPSAQWCGDAVARASAQGFELAAALAASEDTPPFWIKPEDVAELMGGEVYTPEQLYAMSWEVQMDPGADEIADLRGAVLRYDDPFGPATDPDDWEANR